MSTSIQLARRWGANPAGSTVDVDDEQAQFLVNNGYGAAKGSAYTPPAGAAPGQDGSAPTISAVPPRPESQRSPRRENQAWPVEGSPVQYNRGPRPEGTRANREFRRGRPTQAPEEAGNDKDPDTSKASGSKRAAKP